MMFVILNQQQESWAGRYINGDLIGTIIICILLCKNHILERNPYKIPLNYKVPFIRECTAAV